MTPLLFALCVLFGLLLAAGQLLFKLAANGMDGLWSAATSPALMAALALYAATTALWVFILTRLPLSTAYPFSLLGAALVPLLAHFVFGEVISTKIVIGMVFVIFGLFVMYGL